MKRNLTCTQPRPFPAPPSPSLPPTYRKNACNCCYICVCLCFFFFLSPLALSPGVPDVTMRIFESIYELKLRGRKDCSNLTICKLVVMETSIARDVVVYGVRRLWSGLLVPTVFFFSLRTMYGHVYRRPDYNGRRVRR